VAGDDTNGYDVSVSATLKKNGTVAFHGHVTKSRDVQTGIVGSFNDQSFGTYTENDCTVQFADDNQDVKAGAIWITLTCPNGKDSSKNTTCKGTAEVRFENCGH